VFCLNLALETEVAVNAARDQLLNETIEMTIYDEPRNSPTDDTLYCEPDPHTRELPPLPDQAEARKTDEISGTTSDELQNDSGIFLSISPLEAEKGSYSELSSSREPPPPPAVYDGLTKPDYYNVSGVASATIGDVGLICDKSQSDSGISLNDGPEVEAVV